MEKTNIKNRKGQNIVVLVERAKDQKGLAFVMHGLGGTKEQRHIETFAEAFREKEYTAVRFDTTNTIGESDGNYEDATLTNYYEDLEDVIAWAGSQEWYQEPFCLSGHSLGGISTALYAEKYPDKIKGVAPISPVVSGKLSYEAHEKNEKEDLEEWRRTGWRVHKSKSQPGTIKRLKWSHMEDRLKYDLLPDADKLTMPVLLIVGEKDTSTTPGHVRQLYDAVPGRRELHVIKNAPHTFRDEGQLAEIKGIFLKWIDTLEEKA